MLQCIDVIPWFDFIIDVSAADSLDVSAAADSVVVKAPARNWLFLYLFDSFSTDIRVSIVIFCERWKENCVAKVPSSKVLVQQLPGIAWKKIWHLQQIDGKIQNQQETAS